MALESQKISSAGLCIPSGISWPGAYGNSMRVWSQNPDPGKLNTGNCLGTFYVARTSVVTRTDGQISPIEKKVLIINEYLRTSINSEMHDGHILSLGGKVVLAECLDDLFEMVQSATDMVVEVRSFSEQRNGEVRAYKARAELHLSGTAYFSQGSRKP